MFLYLNNELHTNFQLVKVENGIEVPSISTEELRAALRETIVLFKNNILESLNAKVIEGLSSNVYTTYIADKSKEYVENAYITKCKLLDTTLDSELKYFSAAIIFNSDVFSLALDEEKEQLQKTLDFEAGKTRAKIVSEGSFVGEEYLLAHADAVKWTEAGSIESNVPETISVWATSLNTSNALAAEDILQTRVLFNRLLTVIRTIRLLGKKAIADAVTSVDANKAYSEALSKLGVITS